MSETRPLHIAVFDKSKGDDQSCLVTVIKHEDGTMTITSTLYGRDAEVAHRELLRTPVTQADTAEPDGKPASR